MWRDLLNISALLMLIGPIGKPSMSKGCIKVVWQCFDFKSMVQGLLKFEQFYQGNLEIFKTKYFSEKGGMLLVNY
jgi:hypothetical protein